MNSDILAIITTACNDYRQLTHEKVNPMPATLQGIDEWVTARLSYLGYPWAKHIAVFTVVENYYNRFIKSNTNQPKG